MLLRLRISTLAVNKDKLLVVLYSSKTHDEGCRLQKIKITSNRTEKSGVWAARNFCSFKLMGTYLKLRGNYRTDQEQFFVFRDKSPVTAEQARSILKLMIKKLGLDSTVYDMHSLRIGRASDLIRCNKYTIDEVKRLGRWKSNTVYKYIRQ